MNSLGRSFRGMNWRHLSFEGWPLNFLERNFCGVSWLHQNFDGACNSATSPGTLVSLLVKCRNLSGRNVIH